MDYVNINLDAAEEALRVIGGDQLVAAVTAIYQMIHAAERRGHEEGFNLGHDIGVRDGRQEVEREMFGDEAAIKQREFEDWTVAQQHEAETEVALTRQHELEMEKAIVSRADPQPSDRGMDRWIISGMSNACDQEEGA